VSLHTHVRPSQECIGKWLAGRTRIMATASTAVLSRCDTVHAMAPCEWLAQNAASLDVPAPVKPPLEAMGRASARNLLGGGAPAPAAAESALGSAGGESFSVVSKPAKEFSRHIKLLTLVSMGSARRQPPPPPAAAGRRRRCCCCRLPPPLPRVRTRPPRRARVRVRRRSAQHAQALVRPSSRMLHRARRAARPRARWRAAGASGRRAARLAAHAGLGHGAAGSGRALGGGLRASTRGLRASQRGLGGGIGGRGSQRSLEARRSQRELVALNKPPAPAAAHLPRARRASRDENDPTMNFFSSWILGIGGPRASALIVTFMALEAIAINVGVHWLSLWSEDTHFHLVSRGAYAGIYVLCLGAEMICSLARAVPSRTVATRVAGDRLHEARCSSASSSTAPRSFFDSEQGRRCRAGLVRGGPRLPRTLVDVLHGEPSTSWLASVYAIDIVIAEAALVYWVLIPAAISGLLFAWVFVAPPRLLLRAAATSAAGWAAAASACAQARRSTTCSTSRRPRRSRWTSTSACRWRAQTACARTGRRGASRPRHHVLMDATPRRGCAASRRRRTTLRVNLIGAFDYPWLRGAARAACT